MPVNPWGRKQQPAGQDNSCCNRVFSSTIKYSSRGYTAEQNQPRLLRAASVRSPLKHPWYILMGTRWVPLSPRATRAATIVACGLVAVGATIFFTKRLNRDPLQPGDDKRCFPQSSSFARRRDQQTCTRSTKQSSDALERPPSSHSSADEVSRDFQVETDKKVASRDSDQSASSLGHGRFLTPLGVREDLLQKDGGVMEGGFGHVTFFKSRSAPTERFALKKAKDTPAGRRQMRREVEFFNKLGNLTSLQNVVQVAGIVKSPEPMLLMHREEFTLDKMLEVGEETDIACVARVLDGVLLGVEGLYSKGYFHRDIKPQNILVGREKRGILVDFGLCLSTKEALEGKGIGDGTPEYTAPETVLSSWSLQAEIYAVFTCLTEAVVGRCIFGFEELLQIKAERKADVEAAFEIAVENLEYAKEELQNEDDELTEEELKELKLDVESAAAQLNHVKLQLWRLQLKVGQGEPDDAAKKEVASMGPPLPIFVSSTAIVDDSRRATMCLQVKQKPTGLFEEAWANWLLSSTRDDFKVQIEKTMTFLLGHHALDPNPASRPQTVAAAREVIMGAAAVYKED